MNLINTNLINTNRVDAQGNTNEIWKLYDALPARVQNAIVIAIKAINENRLIAQRKEQILNSKLKGFRLEEIAMGSGGVGQLKVVQNQVRFQISYGHSIHNFATCIVINL